MIKNNKININRKNLFAERQGFTLIEILLIVAIIGILAVIIMVIGSQSGRNRAAINSYKTTMNSVKTALEICGDGNINTLGGGEGSNVCNPGLFSDLKYPEIDARCGVENFTFIVGFDAEGWVVATDEACKGCKIGCNIKGCRALTGFEDECK